MQYLISESTKTELDRLIKNRDGDSGGAQGKSTSVRQVIWVLATDEDNGKPTAFDGYDGNWHVYDDCVFELLNPNMRVVAGQRYLAINHGENPAGEQLFVVLAPGEYTRWLRLTSDDAAGGYWPAQLQKASGGGYVDEKAVKVAIRSGNKFVSGGYYLGTLNGTHDGVDVYHANGNERTILKVCEDGVERCDAFYFAAPFKIVEDVSCP